MDTHAPLDLVCLSHLRWNFVYQRPNHLMSRAARGGGRVFFYEEPVFEPGPPRLEAVEVEPRLLRLVPHLAPDTAPTVQGEVQRRWIDELFERHGVDRHILWYYTPLALDLTRHLSPALVAFDVMDELSAFRGAPKALAALEAELLARADVVFTGGQALYEAKRDRHSNVHAMPSSVDVGHFIRARGPSAVPPDQAKIPWPRLGYFGVIDERMDLDLIRGLASARPSWQVVLVGPVAKLEASELPRLPNIHYLGQKTYDELPNYLAGWDVALVPFALNAATRFVSPTKTPEYLAAGRPVVSTPIRDIVRPYGELGLVSIAADLPSFIRAVEVALRAGNPMQREADAFLERTSWDRTWAQMCELLARTLVQKEDRCSTI